jgi:hypothetical protein
MEKSEETPFASAFFNSEKLAGRQILMSEIGPSKCNQIATWTSKT